MYYRRRKRFSYRRKTYGRRRRGGFRRRKLFRRSYRRTSFRSRGIKASQISIIKYLEPVQVTHDTTSIGEPAFGAEYFAIFKFGNIASFTAIYEEYRINCVVVTFSPLQDAVGIRADYQEGTIPYLGYVIDEDDDTVHSSVSYMRTKVGYRQVRFNKPVSVKVYPKYAVGIYAPQVTPTPGTTAWAKPGRGWVDLQSGGINVKHYGLKWCIFMFNSTGQHQFKYNVDIKYYVSFRKHHI